MFISLPIHFHVGHSWTHGDSNASTAVCRLDTILCWNIARTLARVDVAGMFPTATALASNARAPPWTITADSIVSSRSTRSMSYAILVIFIRCALGSWIYISLIMRFSFFPHWQTAPLFAEPPSSADCVYSKQRSWCSWCSRSRLHSFYCWWYVRPNCRNTFGF